MLTVATGFQTIDENYNIGLLNVFNVLIRVSGLYAMKQMKHNLA